MSRTAIVLNLNYWDHNISRQISWNLSDILTNSGQSIYFWSHLLLFAPSSRDSARDQTNGFLSIRTSVCMFAGVILAETVCGFSPIDSDASARFRLLETSYHAVCSVIS